MELSRVSASSLAFSGARRANIKFWTSSVKTTTTQFDSMVVALLTQVSLHNYVKYFGAVILENGDEINLLPYGI